MIVITSMESLPEYCYECPCHDGESGYCQAEKERRYSEYRPFWCPLKEIRDDQERKVNEIIADQPEAPDSRYAMERYEDLCSGRDADFIECILHNRDEFKSWLERMEWHVKECDKLSDELRKTRPFGHWTVDQDWTGYYGECSECHKMQRIGKTPYCPYCGAKMEGADDNTGKN